MSQGESWQPSQVPTVHPLQLVRSNALNSKCILFGETSAETQVSFLSWENLQEGEWDEVQFLPLQWAFVTPDSRPLHPSLCLLHSPPLVTPLLPSCFSRRTDLNLHLDFFEPVIIMPFLIKPEGVSVGKAHSQKGLFLRLHLGRFLGTELLECSLSQECFTFPRVLEPRRTSCLDGLY